MRAMRCILTLTFVLLVVTAPIAGQVKGPVAPAVTTEQIALSESLAPKFDESAAKEQRRLEVFADRPLGGVIQRSFNIFTNYLVMSAEMMPESGYAFRPTPEVRTFGEQINHATSTQVLILQPDRSAARDPEADGSDSRTGFKGRHRRRIQRVDRVLRPHPRRGDRIVVDGSRPRRRRTFERADSRDTCAHLHLQRRTQRRRLRNDHNLSAHAGRRAAVHRPASRTEKVVSGNCRHDGSLGSSSGRRKNRPRSSRV